ncbi:cytidylate kinase [Fulvitalea axinellae]|uniref:Cytidylate kinase n=1 Tax=Fulvitalea axinellae TaxID=1182444 RepID=A0AAU9D8S1_9BACT|nr:cytidylate kinase [Fulvitalea axinellae]
MSRIVVAIDGHSGCGKSSTAKAVAAELGYAYIDTGAMYRCVTLYFLEHTIDLFDADQVSKALAEIEISFRYNDELKRNETYLNGKCVEDEIRKMYVSEKVSDVSVIKAVREDMVAQQRKMGREKGVVMDGRDIGTVVFPDAELKVFMTADVEVRAERRRKELLEKGEDADLSRIAENFRSRDHIDSTRAESPLRKAEDAFELDTSEMDFQAQVNRVLEEAEKRIAG